MSNRTVTSSAVTLLPALGILALTVWFSTWTAEQAAEWGAERAFGSFGEWLGQMVSFVVVLVVLGTLAFLSRARGEELRDWWMVPAGGVLVAVLVSALAFSVAGAAWVLLNATAGIGWVRGLGIGLLLASLFLGSAAHNALKDELAAMGKQLDQQAETIARLERELADLRQRTPGLVPRPETPAAP